MTKNYKKKLIEVAIPLEAINKASAREKSIRHGHPSTLHLWWARRPLAACRAILFAQLVDDPSSHLEEFPTNEAQEKERERLFKIIEDLVIWENSTNEEVLERARVEIRKSYDGELPPVYDPFSGGCSIPLEAQRLGLSAYGSDLNPVAVMIGKAMIEIPPKFKDQHPIHPEGKERSFYRNAEGLAEDVKYYGEWLREQAFKRIGYLYPPVDLPKEYGGGKATVVAWIWARTVPSPDPSLNGLRVPLARSFVLSKKKGQRAWIKPVIENDKYHFVVESEVLGSTGEALKGNVSRKGGTCLISGSAMPLEYIRAQAKEGNLGQKLMAVVVEGNKGRIFLSPTDAMEEIASSAKPCWSPDEIVTTPSHEVDRLPMYGMPTWGHAFTPRQLLAMTTFVDLLSELDEKVKADIDKSNELGNNIDLEGYSAAIRTYIAFSIDRCADAWSTIATWATGGFIRFTFARQAIAMTWDFAECNVFSNSTGNFLGAINWVQKAISEFPAGLSGYLIQDDARQVKVPHNAVISTDPPYYDNIGYADLSDYFYVWLKRSIGDLYPNVFSTITVPKKDELVAVPHRHSSRSDAEEYFIDGMTEALSCLSNSSKIAEPLTIYYAFKQNEVNEDGLVSAGWAAFLQSVFSAGFSVLGTWPIRTERSGRTISVGTNALATSVVLVCRKREIDAESITRAEFIRALRQELPPALFKLQKANIAPVDMPQASIGPGIGIFSRFQAVLESDDSPMTVKTALQIINKELDAFLTEQEGEFDADTRFAITWFEQNGMKAGDFGDADNLARARGLSVDSVKHAGIVESVAGKVRLLNRDELEDGWTPAGDAHLTIWECTQYLIRALQNEGEYAAAVLLKQIKPEHADAARDLAYRLFDICDKQSEAKEANAYNSLVAVWPDLTAQAATISDVEPGSKQLSMI